MATLIQGLVQIDAGGNTKFTSSECPSKHTVYLMAAEIQRLLV